MPMQNMKCLWISQFDLSPVYTDGARQRDVSEFVRLVDRMLFRVAECGFDTVFLQMRPNADSMYPSALYPPSHYVVGAYGNAFDYDPIELFLQAAHRHGISVHAWINPMRGMTEEEIVSVDPSYPVRAWYDNEKTKGTYLVNVGGRLYLNPAYPEVRTLIVNGADELLSRYAVDGLHMDDYFYPVTDAEFDRAAYDAYVADGGTRTLADFRRDALDTLVSALYARTKAHGTSKLFGISPAGNYETVYHKQYANIYRWGKETGFVDYLCPQIYFGLCHETFDFSKTAAYWNGIVQNGNVALLVGMTLGKAKTKTDPYAGSGKNEWAERDDILARCLRHTTALSGCVGVSYFCYQYFYDPVTDASVKETEAEREHLIPLLKKTVFDRRN